MSAEPKEYLDRDGAFTTPQHGWARRLVQLLFVAISILLGVQFHFYVQALASGGPVQATRPPAVEGYLPISSLMSLTYLAKTGVANRVHPAGLVLFTLTLVLALTLRRGFCSWVCPVGTAQEYSHRIGRRLFGRNLRMPTWPDWLLRSLKYLLLGFFLYHILRMPVEGLGAFIHGPYNRIADVKMYVYFRDMTVVGFAVLGVIALLSVVFANFWCRYLCPYGALLGLFSWLSPAAVRRDADKCSGCGRCTRVCPSRIRVEAKRTVRSPECLACYECVQACGRRQALEMRITPRRGRLSLLTYGILTLAAFYGTAKVAETLNYWQSSTPAQMKQALYLQIDRIAHP